MLKGTRDGIVAVGGLFYAVPSYISAWRSMTPEEKAARRKAMWANVKHEAHHYYVSKGHTAHRVAWGSRARKI